MTSYARLLPGQGPGLAGLQPQPAGVQDQIQQLQNAQAPANYRSLPQVNQLQGFQNLQDSQPQMGQGPSPSGQVPSAYSSDQIKAQMDYLQRTGSFDGMPTFDDQPQIGQQSGRDGYINSKLSVGFFGSPEAMQQAKEQFGKDYDADPSIYQPQQGGQPQFGGDPYAPGGPLGGDPNLRRPRAPVPRPPKAEGLGVSSFGGASSNDMQRMLNRGSISGNNMGDVQNQIGEMEAAAAPQPKPPHPFLSEPRQFPFNPLLNKTTPTDGLPLSTAGGIMGQAPPEMAQNIPLMQNQMAPVPGYGLPPVPQTSAGMGFSPPPMNPMQGGYGSAGMMGMAPPGMAQMAAFPQQTMQQGGYAPMQQVRGSQNSPPIQSPFV